jgi:UDP-glucose 4-epimerase
VARPFLTYGPGERSRRLVSVAVRAAIRGERFPMTTGEQTREWNYVDDTVVGLLRCGSTPAVVGTVINVCGGPEVSVAGMVRRVFEAAGAPVSLVDAGAIPQRPGEVPRFFGDATRCREVLGHAPAVTLDDGLRATVQWWRAHPVEASA